MFTGQFLTYILTMALVVRLTRNNEYSWADFHNKEYSKIETNDPNVNTAFYRLSNMYCDPRMIHDSTCPEVKRMDWIIGIDVSWYDGDPERVRLVYLKMRGMLTTLSEKLKKYANFSHEFYEMGIYLAWARDVQTVKSYCYPLLHSGADPYAPILYSMPSEKALVMNSGERASGMVNLFKTLDHELRVKCSSTWWIRRNTARFIIIFHQYASPGLMSNYQPVFNYLKGWKADFKIATVNVAFVSVTSSNRENIFTSQKPHEQHNFPHFGNVFVNFLTELSDEEFVIDYIINCACHRHEECVDDVKKVTVCHFEVDVDEKGESMELCVKNITQEVIAPRMSVLGTNPISCQENPMISCKLEECLHDCDLKSWFSWTECTEDTATKNLTQKRTRLFPRAGISKFTTKSCPEEELRSCELPTTSVFENLTTSIITAETTTTDFDTYIDEITKDPNENAVTIPDDEKFSNFNRWLSQVAGLSVFLLICIVGLALLAISLLIIACHQVAKRRREQSMSTRTGHTAFQRSKLSLSHVSYKSKAASVKSLGPRTVSEKSAAKSLGPARTKSQKSAIASSKKPKTSVFKRLTNSRRKSNTDGILASMASKRPPSKRTR